MKEEFSGHRFDSYNIQAAVDHCLDVKELN